MSERRSRRRTNNIYLEKIAILMSNNDNIAVAKMDIKKSTKIKRGHTEIVTSDVIPKGHRFSLTDICKGELVLQYGYPFGISKGIKKGQIIDVKKVDLYRNDDYKRMIDETFRERKSAPFKKKGNGSDINKTFMGYLRADGRVGTRNFYLIAPTSLCSSDVAAKTAQSLNDDKLLMKKYANIDGIVAASHTEGCGCNDGEIIDRLLLTLRNTITHPNVGGVLLVDLGCEKTNRKVVSSYLNRLLQYGKPIDFISIQALGGTRKALAAAKNIVRDRLKIVNSVERKAVSIKHLVIGTECGASDSFSGITANPLIGATVDKVICSGGSAILSETPEMIGAEAILISRMASKRVAEKFIQGMDYYKSLARMLGVSMEGNFVAGNVEGGLVNLTLKSLGAVLKGGSSKIVDFIDYSEHIKHQGLSIMNGPGNDLESMTGIAAAGANIILFSTGMGTTEGNLIVPVIKISTRTEVYDKMNEDMDFNAGNLLDDNTSFDELSSKLLDRVIEVVSGKKTWAEIWEKRSFQVWTAGKLSL